MIKIIISFLLMTMITGCVQTPSETDKPEEPPVVEQPKKPVEQEKPEETKYVKKIDETKEYVYIDEIKDKAFSDDYKKLADYDYPFTDFDKNDLLQWMAIFYMPDPKDEHLILNIDSEAAKSLNEYFTELYDEPASLFCEWKWIITDDILTIIKKSGDFIPFSTGVVYYMAFHIDLHTGELLTNDDLVRLFNVEESTIQDKIDKYGSDNLYYKEPESTSERIEGTQGMMVLNRNQKYNTIGYEYSEYSLLVPDENNLYFILGVYDFNFNGRILFHKVALK